MYGDDVALHKNRVVSLIGGHPRVQHRTTTNYTATDKFRSRNDELWNQGNGLV